MASAGDRVLAGIKLFQPRGAAGPGRSRRATVPRPRTCGRRRRDVGRVNPVQRRPRVDHRGADESVAQHGRAVCTAEPTLAMVCEPPCGGGWESGCRPARSRPCSSAGRGRRRPPGSSTCRCPGPCRWPRPPPPAVPSALTRATARIRAQRVVRPRRQCPYRSAGHRRGWSAEAVAARPAERGGTPPEALGQPPGGERQAGFLVGGGLVAPPDSIGSIRAGVRGRPCAFDREGAGDGARARASAAG